MEVIGIGTKGQTTGAHTSFSPQYSLPLKSTIYSEMIGRDIREKRRLLMPNHIFLDKTVQLSSLHTFWRLFTGFPSGRSISTVHPVSLSMWHHAAIQSDIAHCDSNTKLAWKCMHFVVFHCTARGTQAYAIPTHFHVTYEWHNLWHSLQSWWRSCSILIALVSVQIYSLLFHPDRCPSSSASIESECAPRSNFDVFSPSIWWSFALATPTTTSINGQLNMNMNISSHQVATTRASARARECKHKKGNEWN